MARFLLSAAVIPGPGTYHFERCDAAAARQWLLAGEFVSAVGYAETARLIADLFLVECAVNRAMIAMEPGDEALVMRLKQRVPASELKGAVGVDPASIELGLLRRIQ